MKQDVQFINACFFNCSFNLLYHPKLVGSWFTFTLFRPFLFPTLIILNPIWKRDLRSSFNLNKQVTHLYSISIQIQIGAPKYLLYISPYLPDFKFKYVSWNISIPSKFQISKIRVPRCSQVRERLLDFFIVDFFG